MESLKLGFVYGISMSFISWIVGMIINSMLVKTEFYKKISNLNFIKSRTLNKRIGIKYFKWIVKNSFFKFFNQKIKLENKNTDLVVIRNEMTLSEISHLIGFVFVFSVAIYKSITVGILFALAMMIPNTLLNLYPSLLQQENKRRIDDFLKRKTRNTN
ncbi:membrane protein [Siansivirga zeaxanthinifaciens CC-SAMT-1]|uniref:Glycosyl-4,4'-diaponeurosporenoate acyltransferase n=1 Tax=Siansivirga zeaxanthinifaciens CC-SAMT-1 TaxID=1454006 RepID=A0A0C5WDP0_9FLAO|nr:membrane protein [Siansivirga zeaxanthinifaciens CC-SAMT-1]